MDDHDTSTDAGEYTTVTTNKKMVKERLIVAVMHLDCHFDFVVC